MWIFSVLPYKLVFLDPISKALGDLDLTDIVFSKLRDEPKLDSNIVLVNISELGRLGLAEQIRVINSYNPKVIALDVLFGTASNLQTDSILTASLNNSKNLVLAGSLAEYNTDADYYNVYKKNSFLKLNDATFGFVNLPTRIGQFSNTIREFAPNANYKETSVKSFASRIASKFNSELINYLDLRDNDREIINYRGNIDKFTVLEYDFVNYPAKNLAFLKDKIVIMGYMGGRLDQKTFNDIYFTPLNKQYAGRTSPDMYGVVIHANIVSMMLERNYIAKVPQWLLVIFGFILCFINVTLIRFIWSKLTDYYGGLAKLLIFFQTVLFIYISIQAFRAFSVRISFSIALIAIILTPSTILLYDKLLKAVYINLIHKRIKGIK